MTTAPGSVAATPEPPADDRDTGSRWSSPVIGIGISALACRPQIRLLARLGEWVVGLVFVLITVPHQSSTHTVAVISALAGGAAWLAWILSSDRRRADLIALSLLAAAGGVSTLAQSSGGVYVFVAAAATAYSFTPPIALALLSPAVAGYLVAGLVTGAFPAHAGLLVVVGLLSVALGSARRQLYAHAREATLLITTRRRLALAHEEAQLVSERNRLGREMHDVLAHTLGAVSIQLTALDSRLAIDPPDELRVRVRQLHSLVGDGLRETRDAVRALRDDALPLETQIARLCAMHDAAVSVRGRSRVLEADEALALYRVVQEALTNAAKHAAGAPVTVTIGYDERHVHVTVDNGPDSTTRSPLADTGGGNGLQGMRTRMRLAGGTCTAGAHDGGWRVTATLPLRSTGG